VLVLEDEPYMAEAVRDGLRLEAIAADIAADGDTALELLSINAYDIAVLDRDVPGPSGDEVAEHIVATGSGMPILMLTAADRLDDKASGFGIGADDYLTKPFELRELVLRLRALDRRRAHNRPPVQEIAGLRVDPFRRELHWGWGQSLAALGRWQEALREFDVGLAVPWKLEFEAQSTPEPSEAWTALEPELHGGRARALVELGRPDEARTAAEAALALDPDCESAQAVLERVKQ